MNYIALKREGNFPMLFCERCKTPIRDGGMAIAVYGEPEVEFTDGVVPVHFFHKGHCDDRKKYPYSQELDSFFHNLMHNAKIKPKRMHSAFEAGTGDETLDTERI